VIVITQNITTQIWATCKLNAMLNENIFKRAVYNNIIDVIRYFLGVVHIKEHLFRCTFYRLFSLVQIRYMYRYCVEKIPVLKNQNIRYFSKHDRPLC
jgi:hypothetical protein